MAITNENAMKNILKVWYKDGVENLLVRDSSALKKVNMTKVEGKAQNFAALVSRGGSVASDYTVAQKAAKQVDNVEFSVTPGKIFSVFTYNAGEIQASLSKKGAYAKIAGNKMMAATTAFRQTLAASFFGKGYGEIGVWVDGGTADSDGNVTMVLTEDAAAKIDIGSVLVAKTSVTAVEPASIALTVVAIDGVNIKCTTTASTVFAANSIICLKGSRDANGPRMPVGLDAWLPIVKGRNASDTDWTDYIGTAFFGVTRSAAPDRLAGQFYMPTAAENKTVTVQKLLRKCRRAGSNADLIIMNDEDFLDYSMEVDSMNKYISNPTKGKKDAMVGFSSFATAFSTNLIEQIFDDSFCPRGKFYICDTQALSYFVYTNSEKPLNDGIADNNPGKQDAEALDNEGQEKTGYNILIDDLLTVRDGGVTSEGPAVEVALNFFGSLAVTNPSVCGVGLFYNASGYDSVLGYLA